MGWRIREALYRRRVALGCAVLPFFVALAHCAAGSSDDADSKAGSGGFPGDASVCQNCTGGASSGGAPPEQEVESSFRSPIATGKYVWATNPESGRVALVDAVSLEVTTVEAGNGPTYLAALPDPTDPDAARAIVLNVKSHDATVLGVGDDGKVTTSSADVHEDANTWAISPSGRWAIAWTDAVKVAGADPTQGFQDMTIIDLDASPPTSVRINVGYRPTRVFIAANEQRVFAITEPGISVIELDPGLGPYVSADVPVTDDPLENPASRDVSVTPDGSYALVRRDGSADVGIVEIATGTRVSVTLSGAVTDLDLSDDGTRAIAVVRAPGVFEADAGTEAGAGGTSGAAGAAGAAGAGVAGGGAGGSAGGTGVDAGPPPSSEVALLPIPGIFAAPSVYDNVTIVDEVVGSVSVSEDGGVALLYTNATPNDHLTLLTTAPGANYLALRTVALKAPVQAVFPTSDGAHAIALLNPAPGSTKAGAFSVIPILADLPPKIQGTEAPPTSVAIEPGASTRAIVTVRDDVKKLYGMYVVRMPQLQVDVHMLASPPLASGMVPAAGSGFVAQEHPEGRITFVKLTDGQVRTLTGFELGAKVVDGSEK
jgi:hypothetical protein